ncbi:MAG: o-succinylbenzoate synthase [Cryobacterium sp.]|nr:o-succinylbenzoate synthase [Cryobacterium sp.]
MGTDFTLPSFEELVESSLVVSLPLKTRFRGVTVREVMLLEGPNGWSEFSPFTEYGDVEASTWLKAAIEFGWGSTPAPKRELIEVNATLPAVAPDKVAAILDRFPGCRTVKVKVAEAGQELDADIQRVKTTREYLGDSGRIRIDANGAWNLSQAKNALRALAEFKLEYAEQPCMTVAELVEIRAYASELGIPIAADESVRKASDPLEVARVKAADILVIKAQPLGGISVAREIVEQAGLPVVVSSALDSSVGISMGAALAACLDELPFACGLGTASLFEADVVEYPLIPVGGQIPSSRIEVSRSFAKKLQSSPDRQIWWTNRLERCLRLLS